jgi:nucleotide-binding universal stress UspA family protein
MFRGGCTGRDHARSTRQYRNSSIACRGTTIAIGSPGDGWVERALDAVWEAETKQAQVLVAKVADGLRSNGLKVTAAVEQGEPKSKIIEAASKWHADLIVVGSHSRKGLKHFLLGSVSDAVARHAGCSVEIARIPSEH